VVALEVVEREVVVDHDLDECSRRVIDSPAAIRKVLQALIVVAQERRLHGGRWSGVPDLIDCLSDAKWRASRRPYPW
jgi:hypothetical protein